MKLVGPFLLFSWSSIPATADLCNEKRDDTIQNFSSVADPDGPGEYIVSGIDNEHRQLPPKAEQDPTEEVVSDPTPSPTLPMLEIVGDYAKHPEIFPLGECQGDCDSDTQCHWGLSCFERQHDTDIPGCAGEPKGDYCFKPPAGHLVIQGFRGKPSRVFPLGRCVGRCETDSDCQPGLACFHREGTKEVPGCTGLGKQSYSYCFDPASADKPPGVMVPPKLQSTPNPTTPEPTPEPTDNPTTSPTMPELKIVGDYAKHPERFPLGLCQGDCDSDTQCHWGLACFERQHDVDIPGCSGEPKGDYCWKPPEGHLVIQGFQGKPEKKFPLGLCEGRCEVDSECQPGLKCFHREGNQEVPGCDGHGKQGYSYCFDPETETKPPSPAPTMEPSPNPTASPTPEPTIKKTRRPTGEPTKEPTAEPTAKPTKDPTAEPTAKPTKDPTAEPTAKPTKDPTAEPTAKPTKDPTAEPTAKPTKEPTAEPTAKPTKDPTAEPTVEPPTPEPTRFDSVLRTGSCSWSSPCGKCQGDCFGNDNKCDKDKGLVCLQRSGKQKVPGCTGGGSGDVAGVSYCYKAPPTPEPTPAPLTPIPTLIPSPEPKPEPEKGESTKVLSHSKLHTGSCSWSSPCGECQGDCQGNNNKCGEDLECFSRQDKEAVPGCDEGGDGDVSGASYCHKPVTYIPGLPTVIENGLLLSQGLTARVIATHYEKVPLVFGNYSKQKFHDSPDGAAVFADKRTGGWIYATNCESSINGGVGAIYFNSEGEVLDYKMILEGTRRNCGGGKTWWNTWLTCEEDEGGQVWEADPWGKRKGRQTIMGGDDGDLYESVAYDNRDPEHPVFIITCDREDGAVVRFSPDTGAVQEALKTKNYHNLLHSNQTGTAKIEYLVFHNFGAANATGGFYWSPSLKKGRKTALEHFPNTEGIDIRDGRVYMTAKKRKHLFILDLDEQTFVRSSTKSGAFDNGPDQVARLLNTKDDVLYFCEDGGDDGVCGVHGRDATGKKYYTILESNEEDFVGETSGLAFSPDNRFMYVAFQDPGKIFAISRTDGYPFGGQRLDIKYHRDIKNFALE